LPSERKVGWESLRFTYSENLLEKPFKHAMPPLNSKGGKVEIHTKKQKSITWYPKKRDPNSERRKP
jgi:hypothetical protein